MSRLVEWLFYLLIPSSILIHLLVSPYTKVEESFNTQTIHDILIHGLPGKGFASTFLTQNYDHMSFPGSVPRTFAGALGLAAVVKPLLGLLGIDEEHGTLEWMQLLVRGVLGMANAVVLVAFGRSVRKAFGVNAGIWYALLQASQFHVIYYASRTLPNMYALIFSTMAFKALLDASIIPAFSVPKYRTSLFLLTIAGVVFRSELAILVATLTLYLFVSRRASLFRDIIPAGLSGLLIGLIITVSLDSFFWQSFPLWPEWTAFHYNTIQGHSADWGVSPWPFYFISALPRLLLNPLTYLLCIPIAFANPALRSRSLDLLIPCLGFISLFSFLPHKEARFILYTVPPLNAVAAAGAAYIWTRRAKSILFALLSLALAASLLLSFAASSAILLISSLNYPGAHALHALHNRIIPASSSSHISIFLDNLSTQTGVTRFLESHSTIQSQSQSQAGDPLIQYDTRQFTYDKTEDPAKLLDPLFWTQFDYVLAEHPEKVIGEWYPRCEIYAFAGVRVLKPGVESQTGKRAGWLAKTSADEEKDLVRDEGDAEMLWRACAETGVVARVTDAAARMWRVAEDVLRQRVLRGWWVEINMAPRISILGKERPAWSRQTSAEDQPHKATVQEL